MAVEQDDVELPSPIPLTMAGREVLLSYADVQEAEAGSSKQALIASKVEEREEHVAREHEELESPVDKEARIAGNAISPLKVEVHEEEEGLSKQDVIVSKEVVRDEQVLAEQEESGSAKEVRVVGRDALPLKTEVQASEFGSSKQAVTVSRVAEMSLQVLVEQDELESLPRDIGRLSASLRRQNM